MFVLFKFINDLFINIITMYKISIIVPVHNSEKYLRNSLESIINQSIGFENIEVIIVNDASTDGTKDIIDEYSYKYNNFKPIHLTENTGAAYGPRNIGLRKATSDYIMFLDADDTFEPDACKVLYDEIKSSGADMVFGRYWRVYDDVKQESYSPYSKGDNDIKSYPRFNRIISFFSANLVYPILYGRFRPYRDKIIIDDVRENPEILMILPAIWTRIFKRELIGEFPDLVVGEDLNFILDIHDNGKIVFLNNKFVTNYQVHADSHDSSINEKLDFQVVLDSITSYKEAICKCNSYGFPEYNRMINPYLLNYFNMLMLAEDFDSGQKNMLKEQITEIDIHYKNRGAIGFALVKLIKFLSR